MKRQRFQATTECFGDGSVRVWARLRGLLPDLEPELISPLPAVNDIEHPASWLQGAISEEGLPSLLGIQWKLDHEDTLHGGYPRGWIDWALQEGLAPWQPFLIDFGPPDYYSSYDYESGTTEYDVSYPYLISQHLIWPPATSARVWTKYLVDRERYISDDEAKRQRVRAHMRSDLATMRLKYDWYYPMFYDEMTPPTGLSLKLGSIYAEEPDIFGNFPTRWLTHTFHEERSDEGDRKLCLEKLAVWAKRELGLTAEQFATIPVLR